MQVYNTLCNFRTLGQLLTFIFIAYHVQQLPFFTPDQLDALFKVLDEEESIEEDAEGVKKNTADRVIGKFMHTTHGTGVIFKKDLGDLS